MKIEINDSDFEPMSEFLQHRRKLFLSQIENLRNEIKKVDVLLSKLNQHPNNPYSGNWNWVKKIDFALGLMGMPASSKQVSALLSKYEMKSENSVLSSVSSNLSVYSKGSAPLYIKQSQEYGPNLFYINPERKK